MPAIPCLIVCKH